MQDEIGEVAGKVWSYINREEETSPSSLAKELDASQNKVYMALGWLAREEKLEFNQKGRGSSIQLR